GNPRQVSFYKRERKQIVNNREITDWDWAPGHPMTKGFRTDAALVKTKLEEILEPTQGKTGSKIDRSKPRLFVLSVGVSRHRWNEYDLAYAAKDAETLAERFQSENGGLFGDVQVSVVTDDDATPKRIREELNWLKRSVTENDVAVVFFAGHGVRARRGLYFFTHMGDGDDIYNTCVNWDEVASVLSSSDASNILLLTDCCHAGAFSADRFVNQSDIAKALGEATNVSILASSDGDEPSVEMQTIQHGVFTHVLLNALAGQADADGDGFASWDEVCRNVVVEVPRLSNDLQHPKLLKSAKGSELLKLASIKTEEDGAAIVPAKAPAKSLRAVITKDATMHLGKGRTAVLKKGAVVDILKQIEGWALVRPVDPPSDQVGWIDRNTPAHRFE
ncbi:MAG: caspase family protein, partial [Planctomycetota bacterium]